MIQSKTTDISRADFAKLIEGFKDLIAPDRPLSSNKALREKAALLRSDMPDLLKVDVYLASSVIAPRTLRPNRDGDSFFSDSFHLGQTQVDCTYFVRDVQFLVENIQILHNEPIAFTFQVDKDSFFEFLVGGTERTVCAALTANDLARVFLQHRQNLFRENPRYYLLASAKNALIKETLKEDRNERFFMYNNGLTCIADSIRATDNATDSNLSDITVENFQIVNGCQTVASIGSIFTDETGVDLNQVRVLAKIIETPQTKIAEDNLTSLIAERSNTQNPLQIEDWKSNDKRQQKWQIEFRQLSPPWFYEIKKGIWATEYEARDAKKPYLISGKKYRKFGLKDLGQVCYAFLGQAAGATDRARYMFAQTRYNQIFHEDLSVHQLLLPHIVFQETERLVKETPTFTVFDAEKNEILIKTKPLRYPTIKAVGQILSNLIGDTEGYLPHDYSRALIQNTEWLPYVVKPAFEALGRKLAFESQKRGVRSIVRSDDWMGDAASTALSLIRNRIETERDMERKLGQHAEGTLSSMLPF